MPRMSETDGVAGGMVQSCLSLVHYESMIIQPNPPQPGCIFRRSLWRSFLGTYKSRSQSLLLGRLI
jgi:hypothetical protein